MVKFFARDPEDFSPEDMEVRLARPEERVKRDAFVRDNHYLEFKRFAGRGLRYAVAGRWLALAGWQTGAFKGRPRNRRLEPAIQFRRLRASNIRFVFLTKRRRRRSPLARMLNRLSDDWQTHRGALAGRDLCRPVSGAPSTRRETGFIL